MAISFQISHCSNNILNQPSKLLQVTRRKISMHILSRKLNELSSKQVGILWQFKQEEMIVAIILMQIMLKASSIQLIMFHCHQPVKLPWVKFQRIRIMMSQNMKLIPETLLAKLVLANLVAWILLIMKNGYQELIGPSIKRDLFLTWPMIHWSLWEKAKIKD